LTVEAVKASSELQPQLQMQLPKSQAPLRSSPPLSLADDSGSNEEALGGIIDWQAVIGLLSFINKPLKLSNLILNPG